MRLYLYDKAQQILHSASRIHVTWCCMFQVAISSPGYAVKSIIDPRSCVGMHNHFCWSRLADGSTSWKYPVNVDPVSGLLQHYKLCHFSVEECRKLMLDVSVDNTALRFRAELMPRVRAKLAELGL
jgi:Glycosyltransferase family 92